MKRLFSFILFFSVLFSEAQNYVFDGEISGYEQTPVIPGFGNPACLATDSLGNVYVSDPVFHRVQKFSNDGTFLLKFGMYGTTDSLFFKPTGIATDGAGNVYVVDCYMSNYEIRIQKFNSSGHFLQKWIVPGNVCSPEDEPKALTVDRYGNMYVGPNSGQVVTKINSSGQIVAYFGYEVYNQYAGLRQASGIVVDADGNVYIADLSTLCIHKFSSDGTFLLKWGGQFIMKPAGMSIDVQGNIYVTDKRSNQIQKYTQQGVLLAKFGIVAGGVSDDGHFYNPTGVAVDRDGNLFIADFGNKRIDKLNAAGEFIAKWGPGTVHAGQFASPHGIGTDKAGNLFVVDLGPEICTIQKFNSDGAFLAKWYGLGPWDGQHGRANSIAIDMYGNMLVADEYRQGVQKFTNDGVFIAKYTTSGYDNGVFNDMICITTDLFANYYVLLATSSGDCQIQKFNKSGTFLTSWTTLDSYDNWSNSPTAIVVDKTGILYVANGNNIKKYRTTGQFLEGFLLPEGDLAFGIALDKFNNVYITTRDNDVLKLSSKGQLIERWGGLGYGEGQFCNVSFLTVDSTGNVYVSDAGNHRVQKFKYTGLDQYTLTTTASGFGTISHTTGLFNIGSTQTLTATPDPGYVFSGWIGGATGTTNPLTITITNDIAITAVFDPIGPLGTTQPYQSLKGIISPNPSKGNFNIELPLPADLNIYTMDGRLLLTYTHVTSTVFGEELPPGLYIVKTGNDYYKIIKE